MYRSASSCGVGKPLSAGSSPNTPNSAFRDNRFYSSITRSRRMSRWDKIPTRICNGQYIVYPNKPLGKGSFGIIYDGLNTKLGLSCAIKFEAMGQPDPQLANEAKLYRMLWEEGVIGIPKIFYWGVEENYTVLVLEKLGPSLEELFTFCGRSFSMKTVLLLADQMISRFRYLHNRNYLHRDVKPENFVMGVGPNGHHVYLLDFGLAKKYRIEKKHIRKSVYESLTGTVRYTSINSHNGITQSRRDDLESLGYILIYFLKGSLPWQGLPARTKRKKYNKIRKKKIETGISNLCKGVSPCFLKYFKYVKNLKFEETPDYDNLRRIFRREFLKRQYELDFVYDWNLRISSIYSNDRVNVYVPTAEQTSHSPSPNSIPSPRKEGGSVKSDSGNNGNRGRKRVRGRKMRKRKRSINKPPSQLKIEDRSKKLEGKLHDDELEVVGQKKLTEEVIVVEEEEEEENGKFFRVNSLTSDDSFISEDEGMSDTSSR